MNFQRGRLALAALLVASPASAGSLKITVTAKTLKDWTVSQVTSGNVVSAPAVYNGTYSGLYSIGLPNSLLQSNDGYWYADYVFTLPTGATKPKLIIREIGADDRQVVELNGNVVASDEPYTTGSGYMTLTDGGANQPWNFPTQSGVPTKIVVKSGFVAGQNDLRLVINNTGAGGQGTPCSPACGGNTFAGIEARVSYTNAP